MAKPRPNSIRILVVDDEPAILSLYQETLRPQSKPNHFDVTLCSQAEEALDAFQTAVEEGKPFAVTFLDLCRVGW